MLFTSVLSLLLLGQAVADQLEFTFALEDCIRTHAIKLAETFPTWGNSCNPPTSKVDAQAAIYEETLTPIKDRYGYQAALWCAMYSLGMTGAEYDPNDVQPNNPNFADWYQKLLCPWDIDECGYSDERLGLNEENGVPVCPWEDQGDPWKCAPNQHPQYPIWPVDEYVKDEADRRTMSCALCGRLRRVFPTGPPVGAPQNILEAVGVEYSLVGVPDDEKHLYTANWDMHPFGAWLANHAAKRGYEFPDSVDEIVRQIGIWKASNGEEIHGFLWQSVRLLAYDTGTLEGTRKAYPDDETAVNHVLSVCKPSWWLSPQTRDDCSHAAGHGYLYYYMDVGRAIKACWTDQIVLHTPGPEEDADAYTRMAGLSAKDLLKWRWLCATGVYHAAGNTLSPEVLVEVGNRGESAEEFLCRHSNVWGENDRYFERCAAGLGIKETEVRLQQVIDGTCKPAITADGSQKPPADWELRELQQFGPTQQLSCNPASLVTGFTVVTTTCPLAFRTHFPCDPNSLDYEFCTGARNGADVKKDGHIVAYHKLCMGHDTFRRMFECVDPKPRRPGTNLVLYAQEWTKDHPTDPIPYNVIDWTMGTPIGVWGGSCTCPDGRIYQVGDEGNMCWSVACEGGVQGECNEDEGGWSFRKVVCEPAPERRTGVGNVNQVVENDQSVGVWGGTCTCPDGQVYLVGDQLDACASLACEGGTPGLCNQYVSLWKNVRVKCNTDPRPPPGPPVTPPSPPSFPPPLPPPPSLPPSTPPTNPAPRAPPCPWAPPTSSRSHFTDVPFSPPPALSSPVPVPVYSPPSPPIASETSPVGNFIRRVGDFIRGSPGDQPATTSSAEVDQKLSTPTLANRQERPLSPLSPSSPAPEAAAPAPTLPREGKAAANTGELQAALGAIELTSMNEGTASGAAAVSATDTAQRSTVLVGADTRRYRRGYLLLGAFALAAATSIGACLWYCFFGMLESSGESHTSRFEFWPDFSVPLINPLCLHSCVQLLNAGFGVRRRRVARAERRTLFSCLIETIVTKTNSDGILRCCRIINQSCPFYSPPIYARDVLKPVRSTYGTTKLHNSHRLHTFRGLLERRTCL